MAPFCEGSIEEGVWRAVIAVAADGPVVDAIDCGRAVDIPDIGSALEAGQRLLAGRFFVLHSAPLAPDAPLTLAEDAEIVDVDELEDACDEREDDEFDRFTVLRGRTFFEYSFEGMPLDVAPLAPLHPDRDEMGWKLGGGATAAMCCDCGSVDVDATESDSSVGVECL